MLLDTVRPQAKSLFEEEWGSDSAYETLVQLLSSKVLAITGVNT
jgi:hypothetical protein